MDQSDHARRWWIDQERACRAKRTFKSFSRARASAVRVRTRRSMTLHPYRCPVCDLWHLSSKDTPRRRKLPRREP